jgi:hypothetical protein
MPQVEDDHIVKYTTAARAAFGVIALFVAVYLLVGG